jgi:hypothetical protein
MEVTHMTPTAMAVTVAALLVLLASSVTSATEVYWTPAHELAPIADLTGLGGCDLDGDGDYDVSVLGGTPSLQYWNVGTPELPLWQLDVTQFAGIFHCNPTGSPAGFGDLDADGDQDLVFACPAGDLHMHWNVGTPQTPAWQQDSVMFQGLDMGWHPQVCPADMDADGDLDLVVSRRGSLPHRCVYYLENTGSPSSPQWTTRGFMSGVIFASTSDVHIAVGDLDGDGDLDMVGSSSALAIQCWENVGTPQSFQFIENPSMLLGIEPFSQHPVGVDLADFNGDGRLDLLIAGWSENYLYLNESVTPVERTSWSTIKAIYR